MEAFNEEPKTDQTLQKSNDHGEVLPSVEVAENDNGSTVVELVNPGASDDGAPAMKQTEHDDKDSEAEAEHEEVPTKSPNNDEEPTTSKQAKINGQVSTGAVSLNLLKPRLSPQKIKAILDVLQYSSTIVLAACLIDAGLGDPDCLIYNFQYEVDDEGEDGPSVEAEAKYRNDRLCPWCRENCLKLDFLLTHLKRCQPRYSFDYEPLYPNGGRITVYVDEFDGSLSSFDPIPLPSILGETEIMEAGEPCPGWLRIQDAMDDEAEVDTDWEKAVVMRNNRRLFNEAIAHREEIIEMMILAAAWDDVDTDEDTVEEELESSGTATDNGTDNEAEDASEENGEGKEN